LNVGHVFPYISLFFFVNGANGAAPHAESSCSKRKPCRKFKAVSSYLLVGEWGFNKICMIGKNKPRLRYTVQRIAHTPRKINMERPTHPRNQPLSEFEASFQLFKGDQNETLPSLAFR